MDGKLLTGKEEDLFISISLSAALSLELSLGPGYRKSLLLSSIVARTSPSKNPTDKTGNRNTHIHTQSKLEILFLQSND